MELDAGLLSWGLRFVAWGIVWGFGMGSCASLRPSSCGVAERIERPDVDADCINRVPHSRNLSLGIVSAT